MKPIPIPALYPCRFTTPAFPSDCCQPIMQLKELVPDQIRYDQWKALCKRLTPSSGKCTERIAKR